jgi:hypothetical protein
MQPIMFFHWKKTPSSLPSSTPILDHNYEEINTRPNWPAYNGSTDNLITFHNCLIIWRQDESWYPIMFYTINNISYDLLYCNFTDIDESVILSLSVSSQHWDTHWWLHPSTQHPLMTWWCTKWKESITYNTRENSFTTSHTQLINIEHCW